MTEKKSGRARATSEATLPHLRVAHHIEVLLRTMRAIERHEEQLCVVMTEIRNADAISVATRRELTALLTEMPGDAYQADLDAVGEALAAAPKTLRAQAGEDKARKHLATKQKKRVQ